MAKKRSAGGIPPSRGERVFEGINLFILIILGALMLFPFLNLLAKSFSSTTAITTGQVLFLPVDFQLGTYKYVMNESQFWDSLKVSLIITIGGTAGSMLVSCLTAYPLSKTWLYGRKPLILFFVFTMLFSGGMVPAYLLMRTLNLINTIWVLFIPFLLSVYNMILLKNFFEEIPQEVEESAQLDGASNVRILVSIVLPMSLLLGQLHERPALHHDAEPASAADLSLSGRDRGDQCRRGAVHGRAGERCAEQRGHSRSHDHARLHTDHVRVSVPAEVLR